MSWRTLIAFLVLALGASAWGGKLLGDWLVTHEPLIKTAQNQDDTFGQAVLDANGKPYVPEPPQPLVDAGKMGVPPTPTPVDWAIPMIPLADAIHDPSVNAVGPLADDGTPIPPGTPSAPPSDQSGGVSAAAAGRTGDIATLDLSNTDANAPRHAPLTPATHAAPTVASGGAASSAASGAAHAASSGNWQSDLSAALAQCAKLSFFSRPDCVDNARKTYCEPHHAWGDIKDCPAR